MTSIHSGGIGGRGLHTFTVLVLVGLDDMYNSVGIGGRPSNPFMVADIYLIDLVIDNLF